MLETRERARVAPNPSELREVAILADVMLRVDAARLYGLITGGPDVDVDRCRELIAQARDAGHSWTDEELDAAIALVVTELTR